ncbi:MAG: hypothetical protein INF75_03030 [Roseomonas sp.]|nr:hypothetical protein [Roseomonas sp.]MCA3326746.1 hypothetical protein [Roseomonas sp.]MCA3329559.1 hypothetical protein [Roseomonas sp.]MCA3333439.1 hypothetical protein [Roseomonas sp.]MCA3346312.1 hypothetical protein [Roseomonas sp.]
MTFAAMGQERRAGAFQGQLETLGDSENIPEKLVADLSLGKVEIPSHNRR